MLVDTQILSFAYKGQCPIDGMPVPDISSDGIQIPSVVAQEFLETQLSNHTSARYYIPLTSDPIRIEALVDYARDHEKGFSKVSTDQFLLNTPTGHNAQIEFGHIAMADAINEQRYDLFRSSVSALSKARRKRLKRRFAYIIEMGLQCVPLSQSAGEIGRNFLDRFLECHESKSNFRNTVNDMMILAMSKELNSELWTEDELLGQFASTTLGRSVENKGGLFKVFPPQKDGGSEQSDDESKGYVNKSWRTRIQEIRGAK